MDMVMFCHPNFLASQSMPRFAQMLKREYEARGHRVTVWAPQAMVARLFSRGGMAKWAGYVDQYVLFPLWVRGALRRVPDDVLFIFCDQALGPWVPLVQNRPHVVHAHDLLALRSALGDFPENPTSLTGRIYQRYIRRGFRRARHFICISEKTRADLFRFGHVAPLTADVVYNGLNFPYKPMATEECRVILRTAELDLPPGGFVLHVGGGQWYKNLAGVVAIYAKYASLVTDPVPLWCVTPEPSAAVKAALAHVPGNGVVRFIRNLSNATLQALYSSAAAFLFPSLAEGFGWPLIEAQACGCAVITTNEPPMSEVAGEAACYLPRLRSSAEMDSWSTHGAAVLTELLTESAVVRARRVAHALSWVKQFDAGKTIDGYLEIYFRVAGSAAASTRS